jgi:predicted dehydrogenase
MTEKVERGRKSEALTRREFMGRAASVAAGAGVLAVSAGRAPAQEAGGGDERIGVGVIGVGGRGGAHLAILSQMKKDGANLEIVAVCDVYRPRMERAANAYGAKGYRDHRELLADPNVDAVCIATPDHHHGYQAIDAVQAGKDVYCEKPVTHWRQFELTKRLAKAVKETGRVFQLGTQGMSDSAWRQMRKLVQDGLIGQPVHAECGFFRVGDWGERGMPIDDPNAKPGPDLDWEAFLGDRPKRPFDASRFFRWRMYEDYAGGPSTDLFPHSLTPVLSILGVGMPSVAVATGGKFRYEEREVPDTFNLLIDFPEKVAVAVLGTQANDYAATGQRGSGQRAPVIRGWDGTLTIDRKANEIAFTPTEGSSKKHQAFPIEHGEDMVMYWQKFLECCRSRNPETLSPMDLAFRVQTALQMGMQGFREGKVARFDPGKEEIVL